MLLKLDRLAAWVLFVGLFLYFITGLSMTKGILTPALAYKLHLNYLTYFVLAAFVIHTGFAIHLAFKRWRIWNLGMKIILVLFYVCFVTFFFYVDRVYQRPVQAVKPIESKTALPIISKKAINQNTSAANTSASKPVVETPVSAPATSEKVFSASELAKYDGQNGNPAYVAVDGVVYDLSAVFINGQHFGYSAGQDLTAIFNSKHRKAQLAKYLIVGSFK
jgi:predicted heme/steroid binding protein